jgi:hypothetical protein
MKPRKDNGYWIGVAMCVVAVVLASPSRNYAQQNPGMHMGPADPNDPINKLGPRKQTYSDDLPAPAASNNHDPFGGQLYCPVTGMKLGVKQPAFPVDTGIGAIQPGTIAKMFGKKPTHGKMIYVCCPSCAETVRKNPQAYLDEVNADRVCFSQTLNYANAPLQRPARDDSRGRSVPPVGSAIQPATANAPQ